VRSVCGTAAAIRLPSIQPQPSFIVTTGGVGIAPSTCIRRIPATANSNKGFLSNSTLIPWHRETTRGRNIHDMHTSKAKVSDGTVSLPFCFCFSSSRRRTWSSFRYPHTLNTYIHSSQSLPFLLEARNLPKSKRPERAINPSFAFFYGSSTLLVWLIYYRSVEIATTFVRFPFGSMCFP
jgi:hypothetical protein